MIRNVTLIILFQPVYCDDKIDNKFRNERDDTPCVENVDGHRCDLRLYDGIIFLLTLEWFMTEKHVVLISKPNVYFLIKLTETYLVYQTYDFKSYNVLNFIF